VSMGSKLGWQDICGRDSEAVGEGAFVKSFVRVHSSILHMIVLGAGNLEV
jgi:hypothetical protein